jgi:ABC-type transport system substrate-binding protein
MKKHLLTLIALTLFAVFMLPNISNASDRALLVGVGAPPIGFDPQNTNDNGSEEINRHIYEGLVEFDRNFQIAPALATEWKSSADGMLWTFKLREGVKFASGAEFDSTAVKKNFDRILAGGLKRSSLYEPLIKEVKIIDKYTLYFAMKVPFGAFLHVMAHSAGLIIDPLSIEKKVDIGKMPSGTGPYLLEKWEIGDYVTLKANKSYWKGAPKTDQITFKVVPDDSTRTMMLETGELDLIEKISPFDMDRVSQDKKLKVEIGPSVVVMYVNINVQDAILKDIRIRQALNFAVDKEAITKNILKGMGEPVNSLIAPITWGYSNVKGYPYNPDAAKKLLAEAGWKATNSDGVLEKDGKKLTLTLLTTTGRYLMAEKVTEAIQGYLKAIGVDCKLINMEYAAYQTAIYKPLNETVAQMFINAWAPSTGDADWGLRPLCYSKDMPPNGGNRFFIANSELDRLLETGMSTIEPKARAEIYKKAQELIAQEAPCIFLYSVKNVIGYRNNLHGVITFPLNMVNLKETSID